MMRLRSPILLVLVAVLSWAQSSKPAGVVPKDELKMIPSSFFYRGQAGSVQTRNAGGIRTKDQKYVLAGLVDTSGYATDIAQKYQGFFITEVKAKIEGSELVPGQYGFGFVGDHFVVTDVGGNDILNVPAKQDANLKRPVPLQIVDESGAYRLYAGRKYVTVAVE
jgi:hypothetical protein